MTMTLTVRERTTTGFERLRRSVAAADEVLTEISGRVKDLTPPEDKDDPLMRRVVYVEGVATLVLLHLNSALISRFAPDLPVRWAPNDFTWGRHVEAAWPVIKREVEAYLAAGTMPHTAEVSGLDPDSEEGQGAAPVTRGAWRTVILEFFGAALEDNTQHFPDTMAALRKVRGMTSIGFTAFDPHSHLDVHVGPNKGALRYQLPVIVPGGPGACRIRVADEMISWREGEAVVFDLSVEHEAWNDSDGVRVLLMIEVPTPLPFPLSAVNRVAQWCYRFHPSYRRLPEHARSLAARTRRRPTS